MLKRNYLWLFALVIYLTIVIPLASSQETQIPVYTQSEAITLNIPCTNNGNFCPSGTNCSATIINPEQLVLINDQAMSKSGSVYQISLNANETEVIGYYELSMTCTNGAVSRTRLLQFEITPNGERPTTAKGILYAGLIILLFALFAICVYYLVNSTDLIPRIASLVLAYLFLIAVSFVAWNMALDFLTSTPFIPAMFKIIFYILVYGLLPLLISIFAYGLIMTFKMKEMQRLIERGVPEAEIKERYERKRRRKRKW